MSSTEAEYIAANEVVCQSVWLRRILFDLQQNALDPTIILCYHMSAIAMTKNPVFQLGELKNPIFHARSKHIKLRHHFIKDMVNKKETQLEFINTNDQFADILKNIVSIEKFQQFKEFLKITN